MNLHLAIAVTKDHAFSDITGSILLFYLLLCLRLGVGVIFLLSGVGKFWDLAGTRQALSDFGVPDAWTSWGTRALPAVEILVGLGLFFDLTHRPASAGAALLSLTFSLAIANLLRQGRTPPCHCFGAIQSAPVGKTTLLRALALFTLSLICSVFRGPSLTPDRTSHLLMGTVALLLVSAGSNAVLWQRSQSRTRQRGRLEVGQRLPAIPLLGGGFLSEKLSQDKKNVVVFTSAGCSTCRPVNDGFSRWQTTFSQELNLLKISGVKPDSGPTRAEVQSFLINRDHLGKIFAGTPSAFWVDEKGTILSPHVFGLEQIEALLKVVTAPERKELPS